MTLRRLTSIGDRYDPEYIGVVSFTLVVRLAYTEAAVYYCNYVYYIIYINSRGKKQGFRAAN